LAKVKTWISLAALILGTASTYAQAPPVSETLPARLIRNLSGDRVEFIIQDQKIGLKKGEQIGSWTLVEVIPGATSLESGYAVFEDYTQINGHVIFVDANGVRLDLPKSSEPTSSDPTNLYLGHSRSSVQQSPTDLLAREILARPGDPKYDQVAAVFEPLRKMQTYSFIGTPNTMDKIGLAYGGRSPNFDPAPYYPPIAQIREEGKVLDGLVGGYLPVLRFVYPDGDGNWTEMLAFAPLRTSNGNDRVQPAWYRVSRIEHGTLLWSKCIDSYHPFPPRTEYDTKGFYRDLMHLHTGWNKMLENGMKVDLPDERMANMARFALVREMMTRVADFPKYGAVDKDYAGSEHDGFPDTFTVDTTAMLEWGLLGQAGRYIDNYFGKFVRDDGSLLYRGPETGQYGRMLTVVAQYVNYGGSSKVLLRQRARIDGVTNLLLGLRAKAKTVPSTDPAYGMIAGWSEADASLDPEPQRYMQPYFSNSTEAARGFRDLGHVWEKIGVQQKDDSLRAWGRRLQREAVELRKDIDAAISRSILTVDGERILPAIAGVKEPFHIAVPQDNRDPQYRSYRAYMEMTYSGSLTKEQARLIHDYRSNHHDMLLGVPTAYGYNTSDIAGFLSYGHGYGLIQHDMIREALLLTYSTMAHQYTRGTWTAPETRNLLGDGNAAPYCTPAQLAVALMTRWLLVFEDPESETLWLGKAIPREWLADGKTVAVSGAPTRWGRVSYSITSHLHEDKVVVEIDLPPGFSVSTKLRLRVAEGPKIHGVTLNGIPWAQFDPTDETLTLPAPQSGKLALQVQYR